MLVGFIEKYPSVLIGFISPVFFHLWATHFSMNLLTIKGHPLNNFQNNFFSYGHRTHDITSMNDSLYFLSLLILWGTRIHRLWLSRHYLWHVLITLEFVLLLFNPLFYFAAILPGLSEKGNAEFDGNNTEETQLVFPARCCFHVRRVGAIGDAEADGCPWLPSYRHWLAQ